MDERWLAVHARGKGLILFSARSHAGIVNVLKHARASFPDVPLYAVMGGLHLSGINEEIIPQTIDAMKAFHLTADSSRPLYRLACNERARSRVRRQSGCADGCR